MGKSGMKVFLNESDYVAGLCVADMRGFMGFTHRNHVADPAVPVIVWPTQRAILVFKHIHDVHSLSFP